MVEVAPSPFYQSGAFQNEDNQKLRDILGITLRIGYTTNDFYTKVSLVNEGLGFAIFPEICISSALQIAPTLRVFRIENYPIRRKVIIARKHREQMSSAARVFWDFLLKYYDLPADVQP